MAVMTVTTSVTQFCISRAQDSRHDGVQQSVSGQERPWWWKGGGKRERVAGGGGERGKTLGRVVKTRSGEIGHAPKSHHLPQSARATRTGLARLSTLVRHSEHESVRLHTLQQQARQCEYSDTG